MGNYNAAFRGLLVCFCFCLLLAGIYNREYFAAFVYLIMLAISVGSLFEKRCLTPIELRKRAVAALRGRHAEITCTASRTQHILDFNDLAGKWQHTCIRLNEPDPQKRISVEWLTVRGAIRLYVRIETENAIGIPLEEGEA